MPTTGGASSPATASAASHRRSSRRRRRHPHPPPRQPWCCSFALDPLSAAVHRTSPLPPRPHKHAAAAAAPPPISRRMRSPGRVSPIDDAAAVSASSSARLSSVSECPPPPPPETRPAAVERETLRIRMVTKGVVLEVEEVERVKRESKLVGRIIGGGCGGEVAVEGKVEVEAIRGAVEMMLEDDGADEAAAMRRLSRAGVARAIAVLEVSFSLMFDRGVTNCLKYLEAVPWNETEEERIKSLLLQYSCNRTVSQDLLARLQPQKPSSSAELVVQLMDSITKGTNNNARKDLRTLVDGILSRTSIYIKSDKELDMKSIYSICNSCLNCLVELFGEASDLGPSGQITISVGKGPQERICKQVDNLNWLLQILIDRQMGEEFVDIWANQDKLSTMHEHVSPMIRYELSRISATIFIAVGSGKLHCTSSSRLMLFEAWFRPLLVDFGWLRKCPKGLNMATLEDAIGQALLTLALKHQQVLFMEWFETFSGQGRECPNLMRAFQVWWRRSFIRSVGSSS
uniref:At3g05675-like ankyrin-like domain-containing protein n=1 Tax=Leersia perrieri TaxID=77586 RepID=A0A0D9XXK1_9ORYZ